MSRVSLLGAVTGTLLVASTSPLHAGVPVQLTKSPAADRHPTWSADGSFIVFESNRSGTDWHLYRIPSGGGEDTQISFDALSQMQPEISPDGTRIVYLQAVADMAGGISSSGISVMPTFGGPPTVLVPRGSSIRLLPTWAPDGSTICFTKGVPTVGNWDIYKVSSTGGPETFVLDFGDDGTSAISPDGQTIIWANHPPNKAYNLVQTGLANPVTPVQLTFETANTAQPAYSWDGGKIAFVSRKVLGKLDLFEIELSSKSMTRLTFDADNSPFDPLNQFPTYSRDGTRLAFSSARETREENIWVLPLVDAPPPPPENILSVADGAGIPGPGTVTIPISFSSNITTPALEFEIVDSPDWLHIVGVAPRGRAANFTASFADEETPHIVLYGATGAVIIPGSGPILDLTVQVRPEAVENDSTTLAFGHIVMADVDGNSVPADAKDGKFYVRRLSGDVNGDNQVDTGDIVRLVEIILKTGVPPTQPELDEADCNDDNTHNALDIVCLLDNVLSKPSVSFAAIPAGGWSVKADEPVLGLEAHASGNDWTSSVSDLAPFQLHQNGSALIAFDAQGAAWASGESHTFSLAGPVGLKAFGAGGRALPVRIEGTDIHIGTPLPAGLHVLPASPNPFARSTEISFSIDRAATVLISVYDVRGAKVSGTPARAVTPGRQTWHWSALDDRGQPLPSGLYVAVVEAGTSRSVVRLTHLR